MWFLGRVSSDRLRAKGEISSIRVFRDKTHLESQTLLQSHQSQGLTTLEGKAKVD